MDTPVTCIVANTSHPVIKGVYTGYAIRDELWVRSEGRIYFDYRPFSELGGDSQVLTKIMTGVEIQGAALSSFSFSTEGPRFDLINLPFLVDSFYKLDRFVHSGTLFDHFMQSMKNKGITGIDISTFGVYGWASKVQIGTLAEASGKIFRINDHDIDKSMYDRWNLQYVTLPWSEVPSAFVDGSIDSLDHTPTVCSITGKFDIAKHYTRINHSMGLFIWLFNSNWLDALPADLKAIFIDVVHDVCDEMRGLSQIQEAEEIAIASTASNVNFIDFSFNDLAILRNQSLLVHQENRDAINVSYDTDDYSPQDFLYEIQRYLSLKGDVNFDEKVDLLDAMIALKIGNQMNPSINIYNAADVNGDKKIGVEEALFALNVAAGLRKSAVPLYKIGITPNYEPYESIDSEGNFVGFDVDLMDAIAERAGFDFEYINTPLEDLLNNVSSGVLDAAISAISILPSRLEIVDFSNAYDTPLEDSIGIAIHKSHDLFLQQINEALSSLVSDGTYEDIYDLWF